MKKLIRMVLLLVVAVCMPGCRNTTADGEPSYKPSCQEQYDLGVRYLSEGNYQESVLAFTAAIEIDPKQASAYVGRGDAYTGIAQLSIREYEGNEILPGEAETAYQNAVENYLMALDLGEPDVELYQKAAEVYIALGDIDAATIILERGFQATEDEVLQKFLDELSGVFTIGDISQGSAEYDSLEEFLSYLGWYGLDYNSRTAAEPINVYGSTMNMLELLFQSGPRSSWNDIIYPGEAMEEFWDGSYDPLRKYMDMGYGKMSISKMDWLLKNIFNCTKTDIEQMKEPVLTGKYEQAYSLDGYYYFPTPGIGGGYEAHITSIEQSNLRYYVEYDLKSMYDDEPTPYCAQVSMKQIDGETYWTLYNKRMVGRSCGDNLTWTLQQGVLTISGIGPMTNFNPYSYSDEPAPPWGDSYIDSVVIEDGVTSIGNYAFWGCEYLTDVQIPDSVTDIGNNAFWACSRLKDISLPNSVRTIGDYAFQACGFETFTVPSGVGSVSTGMFMECENLNHVTIAEGVTKIELAAFDSCFSLRTLTIPGSMTYIDNGAFGVVYLSDVYFGGSRDEWSKYGMPDYINVHYNSTGPDNTT